MEQWTKLLAVLAALSGLSSVVAANNPLDWIVSPDNICGGYFREDIRLSRFPHSVPPAESRTIITAKGMSTYSETGMSEINGDVHIEQPGRLVSAEKVRIFRNQGDHKINMLKLYGYVRFEEHGKLLTGDKATVNFSSNTLRAEGSQFRIDHETPAEMLHAWGGAKKAERDCHGNLSLEGSNYSVCSPLNPFWQIKAQKITVDSNGGIATAKHVRFLIAGVPLMYLPYFSYPIKKDRKSGFLLPSLSVNKRDGFSLEIPYYLNLAPNYDAVLSLNYFTQRGFKFNSEYRYLTQTSHGKLYASFIPRDMEFNSFQRGSAKKYGGQPENEPYLSRINNASPDRFSISYHNITEFNPHWGGSLNVNYVSDDYYMHDFGSGPIKSNADQLLNQAELHYANEHWNFMARTLAYQTLHPIGSNNPEPYSRVPQLSVSADYPSQGNGLGYYFSGDYTNFDHRRDFISNMAVLSAHRIHFLPSINYHWQQQYAFFSPTLRFDLAQYWKRNQADKNVVVIDRVIPIATLDSGLIFERNSDCFRQTIEPRVFYVFVPEKNQNDIPIFDTTKPRFNFENLFHYNRFVGFDRVGDENRLALSLSTYLYDTDDGFERFSASAGIFYQFDHPAVCLSADCDKHFSDQERVSPLLFYTSYHLTHDFYTDANLAWNPYNQRAEVANIRLHYRWAHNQMFNIGYDFVREGDDILRARNKNLSRLDISLAAPLGQKWQVLADWNYNLSHRHNEHYFAGLSYDTCCWAGRLIVSRSLLDLANDDNLKFDTRYYFEFKLKGLGSLGNARPSHLLNSGIVGYRDDFS